MRMEVSVDKDNNRKEIGSFMGDGSEERVLRENQGSVFQLVTVS